MHSTLIITVILIIQASGKPQGFSNFGSKMGQLISGWIDHFNQVDYRYQRIIDENNDYNKQNLWQPGKTTTGSIINQGKYLIFCLFQAKSMLVLPQGL